MNTENTLGGNVVCQERIMERIVATDLSIYFQNIICLGFLDIFGEIVSNEKHSKIVTKKSMN